MGVGFKQLAPRISNMKFSFHWKGSAFRCHGTGVYLIINLNSGKVYVGSAAQMMEGQRRRRLQEAMKRVAFVGGFK